MVEPYFYDINGQQVLMTSIVFPLVVNGKTLATLSIDINLNSLQALSQEASRSLYEGRTTVGILSPVACWQAIAPMPASWPSASTR